MEPEFRIQGFYNNNYNTDRCSVKPKTETYFNLVQNRTLPLPTQPPQSTIHIGLHLPQGQQLHTVL